MSSDKDEFLNPNISPVIQMNDINIERILNLDIIYPCIQRDFPPNISFANKDLDLDLEND